MKKLLLLFFIFCFCNVQAQVTCFKNKPVKKSQLVYDQSDILDASEERNLENKLTNYADTTSTQIAIVIVENVTCDIGLTAVNLGHEWGVGQGNDDNGIVILIASEDRKIYIATGYGVEAYVPDVYANRLIQNVIRPSFREYQYYEGLDETTDVLMGLLSGAYEPSVQNESPESEGIPLWVIVLFIVVILILLSKRNGGGGSQYDYGRDGKRVFGEDWGRGNGSWGDFKTGKGVFFPPSGGGGFGGGSSGGGFGGFGGGGFGGGGAGGSW